MRYSCATVFLSILVVTGLSCRNQVELLPTPSPVGPPPRPACLIVKATEKTTYLGGHKTEHERLTVNGQTYDIYASNTREYRYDEQGRLVEEKQANSAGGSVKQYTYLSTKLTTLWRSINSQGAVIQTWKDSLDLNANGYDNAYFYDEQGHQLTTKQWANRDMVRWVANNRTYLSVAHESGGKLILDFEFDLRYQALPQVYQFRGTGNQALETSYTISSSGVPFYKDGRVYRIDSYYQFDTAGRVTRRIQIDTSYPGTGYLFLVNMGGMLVTDYEYACR